VHTCISNKDRERERERERERMSGRGWHEGGRRVLFAMHPTCVAGKEAPARMRIEQGLPELLKRLKGPLLPPSPHLARQSRVNLSPELSCSPAGHSKLIFWYIIHLAF
jgi:hypothetical protein